jgi:hypothetical protein
LFVCLFVFPGLTVCRSSVVDVIKIVLAAVKVGPLGPPQKLSANARNAVFCGYGRDEYALLPTPKLDAIYVLRE